MALNRKAGKVRKPSGVDAQAHTTNGSSSEASSTKKIDREANARLHSVLLERNLVTEAEIEEAFETDPQSAVDIGEVLVRMGVLSENELVRARAELYGMEVVDLRQPTQRLKRSTSSPIPWPASTT